MPITTPLIADIVFKNAGGELLADIRFDFKPEPDLSVTVEPLVGSFGGLDLTITLDVWFAGVIATESFVERVFMLPIPTWPNIVEPNLEVTFNSAGTTVKVEAGTGAAFERETEFVLISGVPHVILRAFDASDPITIRTWLHYHEVVTQLIALNT